MKKINSISWVITATVISILLLSCGTTTNVFDDSVPAENTALLKFDSALTVKSYNGINVDLKTAALGFGYTGFTIPAGAAKIVVDLDTGRQMGNVSYRASSVEISYNFEAGKEYMLRFWFSDDQGSINKTNMGGGTAGIHVCPGEDIYKYLYKVPLTFR
jgi:hypothetical protein